jgi:large subunit ribosomal protein L13
MQKTYMPKKSDLTPKWYIVDATDKVLGHLATKIANVLRGKNKPIFAPHVDCGDFVIIINADKVKLTGSKPEKKIYYWHSGFKGGIKSASAKKLFIEKPRKILEEAVKSMLPNNKLKKVFMKKLKIYAGEKHPHEAQQPITLT